MNADERAACEQVLRNARGSTMLKIGLDVPVVRSAGHEVLRLNPSRHFGAAFRAAIAAVRDDS